MLIFNIPKEEQELIKVIRDNFDNSEIVEVNSLGADIIVQVVVPIVTVTISAVTSIVVKAMSVSSKVEIEWNGIKIKGNEKQVEKFLNKMFSLNEKEQKEKISKKKGK